MGIVGAQVLPPSVERGIPPTCTAARIAPPSAVAVIDRTCNGGPCALHSLRPGTWSTPVKCSTSLLGAIPTMTPPSIDPTKILPLTDAIDANATSVVATCDHSPLVLRRQIS